MTGLVSSLDVNVREQYNMTKKTLEFAVPIAMQAILKQALQEKDLRIQNKACNDLLDRHGSFPKVTRQSVEVQDHRGIAEDKDNRAVREMIEALDKMKTSTNTTTNPNNPVSPAATIDSPSLTESTQ
jgi:hypothetical protein